MRLCAVQHLLGMKVAAVTDPDSTPLGAATERPFPVLSSPARLPACLPACLPARLPACLQDASHREADSYLFDLDHFVNMHADPGTKPVASAALPPLPFVSTSDCDHLVVNAHNKGGWMGGWGTSRVRMCLEAAAADPVHR
jgi:hypothetical protein